MDISGTLSQLLSVIISTVVIPLLPILTAYITALIKKKTKELENQTQSMHADAIQNIAENTVDTAVTAVNQVYTDEFVRSERPLSPNNQETLLGLAREKVFAILNEAELETLHCSYGSFDSWLESKIRYTMYKHYRSN